MILFNEGLPRSGKSYEAICVHAFKALQSGRPVVAYVEGLDHDKIAQCTGMDVATVRELLTQLTREQVPKFWEHSKPNCLLILDEAQNFWPTGRQRLDPQTTQAITEHGHLGQDIILMGQDLRDVHALWRRRVAQKLVFNKLDAIGAESRYSVTVWKATAPEKFTKLSTTINKYNPEYFGCYASHVDSSIQTENYKDSRANVWNTPFMRYAIPAALVAVVIAGYQVKVFFSGENLKQADTAQAASAPAPAVVRTSASAPPPRADRPARQALDVGLPYVRRLNASYRPRLAVWYVAAAETQGQIEWTDDDGVVRERLTFGQIRRLGESIDLDGDTAVLAGRRITPWTALPQ